MICGARKIEICEFKPFLEAHNTKMLGGYKTTDPHDTLQIPSCHMVLVLFVCNVNCMSYANKTRGRSAQDPPNPPRSRILTQTSTVRKNGPNSNCLPRRYSHGIGIARLADQSTASRMLFSRKISITQENGLRILEVFSQSFHLKPTLSLLSEYFR